MNQSFSKFEVNEDPELDDIARKDKSDLEGSGDEDEHVDSILNRKGPKEFRQNCNNNKNSSRQ